jgi:5-(carboxyamino)imidazole ribonucleotide synthase
MILPGGTIGILGGGQLGRMLIQAGRPMGYRFHIFCPEANSTAGRIADTFTQAAYDDFEALERFARSVDCITFEFENIPSDSLNKLSEITPIHPKTNVLHICQHRQREKDFLKSKQFPCVQFEYATSPETLIQAVETIGFPSVIKTAAFGYDGKGQIKLDSEDSIQDPKALWETLNHPDRVVVEEWIEHKGEYSVVCARNEQGEKASFPVSENVHIHHILHSSMAPAPISDSIAQQAHTLAEQLADTLEVVGLLAVEFFLTQDDQLIVNEMAPRPHNSGHYTIDACHTSQFQQHIRAITGIPLGKTDTHTPAVMINILGDLWSETPPPWNRLFKNSSTQLHLYDKGEARKGRKMGHYTVLDPNISLAKKDAEALFLELKA